MCRCLAVAAVCRFLVAFSLLMRGLGERRCASREQWPHRAGSCLTTQGALARGLPRWREPDETPRRM